MKNSEHDISKARGLCLLPLLLIMPLQTVAQITVSFDDANIETGEIRLIHVSLENVQGSGGITAFGFRVVISDPRIEFLGHDINSITDPAYWTAIDSNTDTGRVGGYGSSNPEMTSDGVLVSLVFRSNDPIRAASISLEEVRLTHGFTVRIHEPSLPISAINVSTPPIAGNDSYELTQGSTLTVLAQDGVLKNDSDPDGDALILTVVIEPARGTLSLSNDGSFIYVHSGDQGTTDSFVYEISDGVFSAQATVELTIEAENTAPSTPVLFAPNNGQPVTVAGDPFSEIEFTWSASIDGDGDQVSYRFLISLSPDMTSPLVDLFTTVASIKFTNQFLAQLLDNESVLLGGFLQVYIQVIASDGTLDSPSTVLPSIFTRGAITQIDIENSVPNSFLLFQNYPNPFNPTTTIRFDLPRASRVSLFVYDLTGRQVVALVDGTLTAGEHKATFDARTIPSGAYLYRLETPEGTFTKTMLLLN